MKKSMNNENGGRKSIEIPTGLGMSLAANTDAMTRFASMTYEQKNRVIEHTHTLSSKKEMRDFVSQIADGSFF